MPVVRYQIRNEYGLADPALYGAADKEDPEALLEGVAMAGMVGVLRQLGDLAEFAAEIFHDLHEEVMATSSRGHGLLLRVQQLEAEFPAIEKGFFNQTDHSEFYHSAAIDWHPNLQIDQNMVTREDMPRFILDSYEESRGPPRLFMLDKFDSAEDGACLKRYSDPSFFKTNFASTGKMEDEFHRERKSRKNKKKIPRWRNGITSEAHTQPHVDQKLEQLTVEKVSENQQVKRVRLKTRNSNDDMNIGRRYKESILVPQSPESAVLCKNSVGDPKEKTKAVGSIDFSPEMREIIMDVSNESSSLRERNTLKPPNREVPSPTPKEKTLAPIDRRDSQSLSNEEKEMLEEANGRVENLLSTFHEQDRAALLANNDFKREVSSYAESKSSSSLNDYRTDDVASELENYLDALTTMESEIETDNETRTKLEQNTFIKEYPKFTSIQERKHLTENLERDMSVNDSLFNKGVSDHANEKSSYNFAESLPSLCYSKPLPVVFMDHVAPADECHETSSINNLSKSEVLEKEVLGNESSRDLVQDQMTPNAPSNTTESPSCCSTDSATGLHPAREDIKSATVDLNTFSNSTKSNEMIDICFGCEYNPQVNSDIQGSDVNVISTDLIEEHEQNGRLVKSDSLPRSRDPKIPIGGDEHLAHDKNTEILVDYPCDKSDLNLQIHDGPLQTLNADSSIDESKAERIITSTDSDDIHNVVDVESTPSTHVEDSFLDLSVVENQEEQLGSVSQEHKVDSGESTPSPRKSLSVIPLDDRSSTGSTEGLFETKESSVSSSEKFEHARSSICSEVACDFSDNDDTSPENPVIFTENEVIASGILSPSPSHDEKLPQNSFILDQVKSTPKDSFSEKHTIESSDTQKAPGTAASDEKYAVVNGSTTLESSGYTLDSSSNSDFGDHDHVCHTGPVELVEEDSYSSNGGKPSVSSIEGGKLSKPLLQSEVESVNSSDAEHVGNIEASNSKVLMGADDQQSSETPVPQQEADSEVGVPRYSKSTEPIRESYYHRAKKPLTYVHRKKDKEGAPPPQDSKVEEKVIESSETSNLGWTKHAKFDVRHLEVDEVNRHPSDSQYAPIHSKALPSGEPSPPANGDALVCNDANSGGTFPLKEVCTLQSSDELGEISSPEKSERIHLNNIHSERGRSLEQDNDSGKAGSGRSFPESSQDSFEAIGSSKIYDSDRTLTNASGFNQPHTEIQSPRQPGFGVLASSKIPDTLLPSGNTVIQHEFSELPLEEDPPPPPLPPIQWRMGKLRPNSIPPMGGMAGAPGLPNQFTLPPSLDHSCGSPLMGGTMPQPLNPFLDVRIAPNGKDEGGYRSLEESTSPFHSSVAACRVEDGNQKTELRQEALNREISESPVAPPLEISNAKSQQVPIIPVGESMQPSRPSIAPVSIDPEPRHEAIVHPYNTFFSPASTEVERTFKDRMVEGYFSDTPSTAAVPQSVMSPQWVRMYTSEDEAFPTEEYQKPIRRPHSLLNRPRDPLIEAVASHDKSTLRRVSELVRPSAKPEGERNVLLEQIRSKSFNLKPAAVAKPSMKGPPTNLKVAAILEKANAIRQAVAGSDEDDDGDSWSDS